MGNRRFAIRLACAGTLTALLAAACSQPTSIGQTTPTPAATAVAGNCPVSPFRPAHDYSPDFGSGPAFGDGPVYALFAGGLGASQSGWREGKILWISDPRTSTDFSVTGSQLDGASPVAWDTGSPSLGGMSTLEVHALRVPSGWGNQPSTIMVRNTGCFALHASGAGLAETITLDIR